MASVNDNVVVKEIRRFGKVTHKIIRRLNLLRAGKVGWAASVLYTITGEPKYKEMAVRIGDNLVAAQSSEGYWKSISGENPSSDITAEMVIWLDEIYKATDDE